MKVCHISDRLPGFHSGCGGAEQAALRVIDLLNKMPGVDITAISMRPENRVEHDFKFTALRSMESFGKRRLVKILSAFKNRTTPFDPVSFVSSYRLFKGLKPDIVHVHKFNLLSFSVIESAVLLDIPVVMSIYDYWLFCPGGFLASLDGELCRRFYGPHCLKCNIFRENAFASKLMLLLRFKPMFDRYLERVKAFVVLSSASAGILEAYGIEKKRIHTIPQAVSLDENAPAKEDGGNTPSIFFAGWMERKKGLDVLLRAMPHVLRSVPEARLRVFEMAADEQYGRKIRRYIDDNGLNSRVVVSGRVSREEFRRELKNSLCVAVPEQWENMSPVIIAEALMNGKPVVASSIGGIPEFVKDGVNGFLAERNNPESFAEKIVWLLKHREEAHEMGERAKRIALEIFDKDRIAVRYMKLYSLLSTRLPEKIRQRGLRWP